MAIRLGCRCGQQIITEEANMGQTIRCPACNLLLRVPMVQQQVQPPVPQQPVHLHPGAPPGGFQQPPAPAPMYPPMNPAQPGYPQQGIQPGYQQPLAQAHLQPGLPPQPMPDEPPLNPDEMPVMEDEEFEEEEQYKEQKKKEKKRLRRNQLKMTSWGLMLIYWAMITYLASIGSGGLIGVVIVISQLVNLGQGILPDQSTAIQGGMPVILFLTFVSLTLGFIYVVLHLIGSILCCWVPPKSNARPLILTSVSMVGAVFLFLVIAIALTVMAAATGSNAAAALVSGLGLVAMILVLLLVPGSFVLFMLFLRSVAFYLNQRSTGDEVISVMATFIALMIIAPVVVLFSYLIMFAIIFVGYILSVVVLLIWYAYLVWQWVRLLNVVAALRNELAAEYGV